MGKLKFIVCGTGRCGTVALAKLLTSSGIPCGHESIFTPGGIIVAKRLLNNPALIKVSNCSNLDGEWLKSPENIVADSSFMAPPFIREPEFFESKIIHLVRHPLKVINSFINVANYFKKQAPKCTYQKFLYKHYNLNAVTDDICTRAAAYYVRCNQLIEKFSTRKYIFHPIESNLQNLSKFIDRPVSQIINKRINHWGAYNNVYKYDNIKDDKIRSQLLEMTKKYGYNLEVKHL